MQLLPQTERDYIGKGSSEGVRKERLLARTLIRTVLARYCDGNISPMQLCFKNSPTGKPWLVSQEACKSESGGQLFFNLTHTENLLGVAVARGRLVGLDVENSSRMTRLDPLKLANKRFSPREAAVLQGLENRTDRALLFMRLWTLKEAYVKATGKGISAHQGLKGFTFELLSQASAESDSWSSVGGISTSSVNGKENVPPADKNLESIVGIIKNKGSDFGSLPFSIKFQAAKEDPLVWEALLMEVWCGHTAALIVESGAKQSQATDEPSVGLRVFKTVPLLYDEEVKNHHFRVCGYGKSV